MESSPPARRVTSAVLDPHPVPLVPLRIFRSRTLAGADALPILIGTIAIGVPFVLTLYTQQRTDSYHPRRLRRR